MSDTIGVNLSPELILYESETPKYLIKIKTALFIFCHSISLTHEECALHMNFFPSCINARIS